MTDNDSTGTLARVIDYYTRDIRARIRTDVLILRERVRIVRAYITEESFHT